MKNIFLILTIISTTAFAQSDETAVKEVVNKLFTGNEKVRYCTDPISKIMNGRVSVENEPLDSFLVMIGKPHRSL